jgi:hypothetical protein
MTRADAAARRGHRGLVGVVLLAFIAATPARAEIGTADVVPAATLLLPYFEVDVAAEPPASAMLLTIMNASAAPTLARLVLWTDYGVHTYGVNLFLTGYDVETVDLRDIFDDAGPAVIAAHRGQSSALFDGLCAGFDHGDALARGYVTIDNVNQETDLFPGDPGYFAFKGIGVANDINQLWGQYLAVDTEREVGEGGPLVHVEAHVNPLAATFYSRETNFSSADNRERLATSWGTRYWNGLTDLICWRDDVRLEPFPCPLQSAAPISTNGSVGVAPLELIVFDHAETAELPETAVEPCLLAAGRVRVGGPLFPVSAKTGWIYANANPDNDGIFARGVTIPPTQAFIGSFHLFHPAGLAAGIGGVALDGFGPIGSAPQLAGGGGR